MKRVTVSFLVLLSMVFFFVSGKGYAAEFNNTDYVILKNENVKDQYKYIFNKNISYEINDNGEVIITDNISDKEYLLPKNGELGNAFGKFTYSFINEHELLVNFYKTGEVRDLNCPIGTLGGYYAGLVTGSAAGAGIATAVGLTALTPIGWTILGVGTLGALAGGATGFATFCH